MVPGGWEVLFGGAWLVGVSWLGLVGARLVLALCKEARSGAKTPLLPPQSDWLRKRRGCRRGAVQLNTAVHCKVAQGHDPEWSFFFLTSARLVYWIIRLYSTNWHMCLVTRGS